jgi:PAS domain S-box-containing protein
MKHGEDLPLGETGPRPRIRASDKRQIGVLAAVCAAFTSIAIAVAVGLVLSGERNTRTAMAWVNHTDQVIAALDHGLENVQATELHQRNVLLTGQASQLEQYRLAAESVWRSLSELQTLAADNPRQQNHLNVLSALLRTRMATLDKTIELAKGGDLSGAISLVLTGEGQRVMNAMRPIYAAMLAEEQSLLQIRRARREQDERWTARLMIGLLIAATGGISLCGFAFARALVSVAVARRGEGVAAERQRLLAMMDLAAIMVRDFDGTIRLWSEGCRRLYGWAAEEAIGQSSRALLQTAFPVPPSEIDAALMRDGEWVGDLRQRTRDGAKVIVAARKVLHRAADRPAGESGLSVMENVSDVTAQRTAEAALRDSEARLHLAQQVGAIGSTDRSELDDATQVSAEYVRLYGLPTGQTSIAVQDWLDRIHPEDRHRVAAEMRVLYAGQGPVATQFRIRRPDGSERWIAMRAEAFAENGGARRVISAHQDVSEVVAAREALAVRRDELERLIVERTAALGQAEAQFRAVFDSQFQFVSILSPDGAMLLANRTALEAGGLSTADVVGRPFWHTGWWPETERQRLRAEVAAAAGGALVRREVEVNGAGGRRIWIDFSLKSVWDPVTQRVKWIIAEGRDLTEHRLAEHLERARDAAERATLAKSRFLSGTSHELRTPLNGILGYAELLRLEGGLSKTQSARVDAMLDAGAHLLQVINRVLDLSKVEAEGVESQPLEVELRGICRTCLDLVRPTAEAKGLALDMDVAPAVPHHIAADPTRLRQILLNLLGNAVKFTTLGSVTLRLRAMANGAGLRFEVADTGPGIPAEHRDRLFKAFERLDADSAGTVEGAGLGLSLSAQLAMQMGGRLGHENNPKGVRSSCGSVFWLELPFPAPNPALLPPTIPASDEPDTAVAMPSGLRVLVVDDTGMNRDIAASFIRAAGHEVECADGGAEAIAAVAATDFDIVLMDVVMPEMDGLEATRRIRALQAARGRVPIVALTAHAFTAQIEECRQAGMDGHLAKPFTMASLVAALGLGLAAGQRRGGLSRQAVGSSANTAPVPAPTSPNPGADHPVLDLAALERTSAFLKPGAVDFHMRTVAAKAQALLSRLSVPDALARDGDGLATTAHALAGSCGMLGFDRLAFVARTFENAVRTNSAEIPALAGEFSAALEATIQAIETRAPVAISA